MATYVVVAIYTVVLAVAMKNFVQFIVRGNKRISPLFLFYILVAACLVSDLTYAITLIEQEINPMPLVTFLPPTFKIALGVE